MKWRKNSRTNRIKKINKYIINPGDEEKKHPHEGFENKNRLTRMSLVVAPFRVIGEFFPLKSSFPFLSLYHTSDEGWLMCVCVLLLNFERANWCNEQQQGASYIQFIHICNTYFFHSLPTDFSSTQWKKVASNFFVPVIRTPNNLPYFFPPFFFSFFFLFKYWIWCWGFYINPFQLLH